MIQRAILIAALGIALPGLAATETQELRFGEAITYHNMSVVPVYTSKTGPFTPYTLLEDGLKAKTLKVRELDGNASNAQVNSIQVKNTGKQAVFLLSGEMILGGKQDRILESDVILPPDGKWKTVAVFCVEQGRWAGGNMSFKGGGALAHGKLRMAAVKGSQGEVWSEVARKNATHGTTSASQTYRRTIQNGELRKKIKEHRAAITSKIPRGRLAGFVFGLGDQVRVADLFGNPVLVDALQEKLLSAYILEALEHDDQGDGKVLSPKSARSFVGKARRTKGARAKKNGRASTVTKQSKGWMGTETKDSSTGESVRESYMAE